MPVGSAVKPALADSDWLLRVRHLLSPELRREYLSRMRAVRQNCYAHRWKYEAPERAVG